MAGMLLGGIASPASAATVSNACANSATANFSQIDVTTSGSDGVDTVAAGGTTTLSGLSQSGAIPGNIIVAGYNLGLLVPGVNTIPANVRSTIEATNTVEGVQNTNTVAGSVMTTIADPDGIPGTGDETATDASFSVSYNDLNWTAGASGTIGYRQDSIATAPPTAASNTLLINIVIGGFLNVQFRCAPGTVTGPNPGVIALIDPAPSFDTTSIGASVNNPPTADAGPDQMVASGATVDLDGTGSSDPDSDPLTYSWTQIGGPAVTLTGADTAMPSFTAPTGPTTLVFDLEVCDGEPLCDTDTVVITVAALPATVSNACANSATANFRQIDVTTSGSDGVDTVAAGGTTTLSGLSQSGAIPGDIFVAGYNLGLLAPGVNTIPGNVRSTIEATNTVEGVQNTNTVTGSVMTTIADPDGIPGTGDETATDASFSVSYNDLNWTAGASGTIGYRQDSIATAPPTAASNTLLINIVIGGFLNVQFRCAPGTVTGPDPGVIALIDPAPSFDTTSIEASVNNPPTADAGPDQMVASGATVNLDGTGSSDPDSDPLTYSWTQIGGPAVTLTGADTAMPSFTAPTGPTTLVFDLEVCDGEPLCDTDTVAVTVDAPIPVFLGFTQPLPKTKLAKSSSAITVKFRLGDDAGMPLSDLEASQLQTQVTLSANLDGSNPLSLVTCAYSKTNHRYQCSLKPPKNVAKYPTPYYITAYELIGGTNVKAPTGSSSTTDNPVTIYFK